MALDAETEGIDLRRYAWAVWRRKWLVLLIALLGTATAIWASRKFVPEYSAEATLWVDEAQAGGPVESVDLLGGGAWAELLGSYAVLDQVVQDLRLYVSSEAADSALFADFALGDPFSPGAYELRVAADGRTWQVFTAEGAPLDEGTVGEPIGERLGFRWSPPAAELAPGRIAPFTVIVPRDAARALRSQLVVNPPERGSRFLRVRMAGPEPRELAQTVNAIADRFISIASELKAAKVSEQAAALEDQLANVERNLREAETSLQGFRVQTVTLPSGESPVAPGLQSTQDPVYRRFFDMKIEREDLRRDREAIERALAAADDSGPAVDALEVIPTVRASTELMSALNALTGKRAEIRALLQQYTEEYAPVARLRSEIETLEHSTIPGSATALVQEIRNRESELDRAIGAASEDLRQIPARSTEEARLRRRVTSAENLYTTVRQRYEAARLGVVTSFPDVRLFDRATVPTQPTNQKDLGILLIGILGSIGAGILLAVLLDRFDPRWRYPEQVSTELGIPILGVIPHVEFRNGSTPEDQTSSLIEAFREVRLGLLHAHGSAGPIMVTLSSTDSGEGKSFITSNLGLAFAELGHRTLLIDGDVRRGSLHRIMNMDRRPGLTDTLTQKATLESVVRPTVHANLDLISSGSRIRKGPELLASRPLLDLLQAVRREYDVILVDSPPLTAGVDALLLGKLTGSMALVVRTGTADRELTHAKLEALDRLPIRLLGAILNAVPARGAYRYYGYISGYDVAADEEETGPWGRDVLDAAPGRALAGTKEG